MSFIHMVGEPTGGWGPSAMSTFRAFAKASAARESSEPSYGLSLQLQRLCTTVRRARARAVLRRFEDLQ
eukprot:10820791-Karenia_brevis.AAC.1